jgi:hypothetical protein
MLRSIVIKNFMGIEFREMRLEEHGALIVGGNARGKTSLLAAIRVGLLNEGASADMVRLGADEATLELRIDGPPEYGELSVRRRLTPSGGNSLDVKDTLGRKIAKPQSFLRDLLGASPLDALRLWSEEDAAARRRMVLEAIPIRLGEEEVRALLPISPILLEQLVGTTADGRLDLDKHAIEVINRIGKGLYDARTEANREVEKSKGAAKSVADRLCVAEDEAAELHQKHGAQIAPHASVREAADAEHAAVYALRDLEAAGRRAEEGRARTEKIRGQIGERRGKVVKIRESAPTAPTAADFEAYYQGQTEALSAFEAAHVRVLELEAQLAAARQAEEAARALVVASAARREVLDARQTQADQAAQTIATIEDEIEALEDAVRTAAPPAPTEEQIAQARDRVEQARLSTHAATLATSIEAIRRDHEDVEATATKARARADALDKLVKRWQHDVPREVFASHGGIPGLTIDEDVRLDGVSIGHLSGKERLALCVALARKLNAKSKIIVQDGLEAIDEDELRAFLAAATAGGYQLLATRVTKGDLTIVPVDEVLAAEPATAAALRGGAA